MSVVSGLAKSRGIMRIADGSARGEKVSTRPYRPAQSLADKNMKYKNLKTVCACRSV
jgi:hypothetical protein